METTAYLNDTETSSNNIYTASTLGFSLNSPGDFSPEVTPTATSSQNINLTNDGLLGFNYGVSSTSTSGTLCNYLNLTADLEGNNVYTGTISGFNYNAGEFSTTTDEWQFTANLTSNDPALQNQTCNFGFVFDGEQMEGPGFYDQEIISNTITAGIWLKVVINKVYYDVDSNHGEEGDNEWIEIYNPLDTPIDISGWMIVDNNATDTIPTSSPIPAKGFAVVTGNASTWGYWNIPNGVIKIVLPDGKIGDGLANDGDRVILKMPNGTEIDAMSYGNVVEGHILGRVPTGLDTDTVADWHDLALPSLTLDYPVGGEIWYVGHDYDIQWTAINPNGDQDNNKLSIDIYYSKNSGNTWAAIATSTQNDGSYNWHVPLFIEPGHYYVPSPRARIKIVATGPENFMVQVATSSRDFCPPIDYDVLSPEDQQLVDQLVSDGVIDESEIVRGGIIEVEEQAQPENSGPDSDLLTSVVSEIVDTVQGFLGTGQDETATTTEAVIPDATTTTTTEQTLPEETPVEEPVVEEIPPAIEEQPVVVEETIIVEPPQPSPEASAGTAVEPILPPTDPPAPTE